MKLSIVMPVINGARFIDAAIESIRIQTHTDWELIVMDGGSSDETIEIVSKCAAQDQRISLFSGPDKGMYDAILTGFEKASGDWLAWLNSDDLYTPWAFSTIAKNVETGDHRWVTGCPACWDTDGRLRYLRPSACFPQGLIRAGWFHQELLGCLQQESIFFSKELISNLSKPELERVRSMRHAGDFLLWRLMAKHTALASVPSILGGFRRHSRNQSLLQKEAYMDEILGTNPFRLPKPIASLVAVSYRAYSSWAAVRIAADADTRMTYEILGPKQDQDC